MTDILSTISRGKRPRHIFALIYGTDGVGKSSWASHAPKPIFVGAEKGTEQLDVARFPQTETITDLLEQLRALQTQKHEFQIVVLDSLDWIEPLIRQLMELGKISEPELIAVLRAAQIQESLCASSLAEIPDKPLRLATENWASVIALVDEIRAQKEAA